MLSRLLQMEGAEVRTARSGFEAIDVATDAKFDLIISDISMPGMTGFDVAARLREEGSRAAIVFLTVYADDTLVEEHREELGIVREVRSGPLQHDELLEARHAVRESEEDLAHTTPAEAFLANWVPWGPR